MDVFLKGIIGLGDWKLWVMYIIGGTLIYLAIAKEYEPTLLLPLGFGTILTNIPFSGAVVEGTGALSILFDYGISNEMFPLILFIAIGAMIDFTPLLQNPKMLLFGGAAQFGIFVTIVLAAALGFKITDASAIGVIGAADGPTSIFVANRFAKDLLAPISVAAYSYMALVPLIQPPVIKLLTTKEERLIRMDYKAEDIPRIVKILFPILITFIAGLIAPDSVSLIGFLMFGNLIRECGVLNSISETAQTTLANLITIVLGISIASTMTPDKFLNLQTLMIMGLGLIAFIFDTAGGVIFAKILNLFSSKKINPMVGGCGISAFPMSARVVHKMGQKEDPFNFLLMPAVSANVAGQIGSVIAGGIIIALLSS